MSPDLCDFLRCLGMPGTDQRSFGRQAADEIERLREQSRLGDAAIDQLTKEREDYRMRWLGSMTPRDAQLIRDENARLRDEIKALREAMARSLPVLSAAAAGISCTMAAGDLHREFSNALTHEQDAHK